MSHPDPLYDPENSYPEDIEGKDEVETTTIKEKIDGVIEELRKLQELIDRPLI